MAKRGRKPPFPFSDRHGELGMGGAIIAGMVSMNLVAEPGLVSDAFFERYRSKPCFAAQYNCQLNSRAVQNSVQNPC